MDGSSTHLPEKVRKEIEQCVGETESQSGWFWIGET